MTNRTEEVEARETETRTSVIFVGSFKASTGDGGTGGQMFACRSLLMSPMSNYVHWVLVDSTTRSIPLPNIGVRAIFAMRRMMVVTMQLLLRPGSRALIFAADGLSFIEKGCMVLLARVLGHRTILCPRSGIIVDDLARSKFMRWFVSLVMRQASVVLCQSSQWREFFSQLEGVDITRLQVVPNWIQCEDYLTLVESRKVARQHGQVKFLYLGWLEEFKGVDDLIEAVHLYRECLQGAHIEVCGSGSREKHLRDRVRELNLDECFTFSGWVNADAKTDALVRANVLVIPSWREGMPNAALEAMASGIPVIATKVGGLPELVRDGETGWLVPPRSPMRLGAALAKCNEQPQLLARMGRNALDQVKRNHDISVVWPQVLSALGVAR